ncbi:MAG: hypothetical protein HYZ28_12040 [Myxococcales bacterium]|nr:hypothetical protein [Myxococcales bacterium]
MRGLAMAGLLFLGCGTPPNSGGPCRATCDCKLTTAPADCLGEWVCNPQKTCEYACKSTCSSGAPSTCRDGEECNGSICSERTSCPK